jgi:hypothetical protein
MTREADLKLLLKLTISADELPELYQALVSVPDARRRTRRLKYLAAKGLFLERTGSPTVAADSVALVAEQRRGPTNLPEEFSAVSFAHGFESASR